MNSATTYLPARRSHETQRRGPVSIATLCAALRISDACMVVACAVAAREFPGADAAVATWKTAALIGLLAALLTVNVCNFAKAYSPSTLRSPAESVRRTTWCWLGSTLLIFPVAQFAVGPTPGALLWLACWNTAALAMLILSRIMAGALIQKWKAESRLHRNAVILGLGPIGQRLISHLVNGPETDFRVIAAFHDVDDGLPQYCWRVPVLGAVDELDSFIRQNPTDVVIVALPLGDEERIGRVLETLATLPVDVRLFPDLTGFRLPPSGDDPLNALPLLKVADQPLSGWRAAAKSAVDRVLAPLIVLLISPLMLLIALAIKLDSPGPVLFRQTRYGFNNRLIEVFKFRTMFDDQSDANGERLTSRNDSRVTRVGALLRKTSLDELPQFFNVLRGEMSIVGPRPHALQAKAAGRLYQDAVRDYHARHRVKPGITGWAQVNGWRGETRTVEQIARRVEHDLEYIEKWSVALDLRIILKTALTGFTDPRAY